MCSLSSRLAPDSPVAIIDAVDNGDGTVLFRFDQALQAVAGTVLGFEIAYATATWTPATVVDYSNLGDGLITLRSVPDDTPLAWRFTPPQSGLLFSPGYDLNTAQAGEVSPPPMGKVGNRTK